MVRKVREPQNGFCEVELRMISDFQQKFNLLMLNLRSMSACQGESTKTPLCIPKIWGRVIESLPSEERGKTIFFPPKNKHFNYFFFDTSASNPIDYQKKNQTTAIRCTKHPFNQFEGSKKFRLLNRISREYNEEFYLLILNRSSVERQPTWRFN